MLQTSQILCTFTDEGEAPVKQLIASTIPDSLFMHIRDLPTAHQIWVAIVKDLERKSRMVSVDLRVEPGGAKPSTAGSNSLGMLSHTHLEGCWLVEDCRVMRGIGRLEVLIEWGHRGPVYIHLSYIGHVLL